MNCLSHLGNVIQRISFCFIFLIIIKMGYIYWFNREELLKNAYDKYHNKGGKEKTASYYKKTKKL